MPLEAQNVGYFYRKGHWIFRHVHLQIDDAEFVGLYGPNGCGKTTLGRLLAGYIRPAEGLILLDGRPLPDYGFHPVQMLFQHPERAVNPCWTVRRILTEGWNPDFALLEQLGIPSAWFDRRPHELSGGELQRICIARALGPQTRYLVADEMTAMLDAVSQAHIWQTICETARRTRRGMLIISHDRALLHRVCDRVLRMR